MADVALDVLPILPAAVDCVSHMRHSIGDWHAEQRTRLQSIANSPSLLQMSEQIMALAPLHVRWAAGPHAHPALSMVFIDALDWPDKHFAYRQYAKGGLHVVGWLTDAGPHQHHPAKDMAQDTRDYVHPERLTTTNTESNALLAASMRRSFRTAKQASDSSRLASFSAGYTRPP